MKTFIEIGEDIIIKVILFIFSTLPCFCIVIARNSLPPFFLNFHFMFYFTKPTFIYLWAKIFEPHDWANITFGCYFIRLHFNFIPFILIKQLFAPSGILEITFWLYIGSQAVKVKAYLNFLFRILLKMHTRNRLEKAECISALGI
jgi:hypothetical protein